MKAATIEIIPDIAHGPAVGPDKARLAMVPKSKGSIKPFIMKWTMVILPPVLGILMFIGIWALIAGSNPNLPGPGKTWVSAVQVFSDPFYQKGPNDQGIGWNILASLKRVGIGFGMAALVGIPVGFLIGRWNAAKQFFTTYSTALKKDSLDHMSRLKLVEV